MKKIIIVLEGGNIQNIVSEEPLEVIVVDYDTFGADPEEKITRVLGNNAIVSRHTSEHNAEEIARVESCIEEEEE